MASDFADLQAMGVGVLAINANDYHAYPADSPEHMIGFAETYGFTFPYLIDTDQSVAKSFDAVCTPDFFASTPRAPCNTVAGLMMPVLARPTTETVTFLMLWFKLLTRTWARNSNGPAWVALSNGVLDPATHKKV